jgi:hypothetical protein
MADERGMRALSIRQPYAELILRVPAAGRIKPIESRGRPTTIIGRRFHIHALQKWAEGEAGS